MDNGGATNLGKRQRLSSDNHDDDNDKGDDGIGAPQRGRGIGSQWSTMPPMQGRGIGSQWSTMPPMQCSSETPCASARSYPTKVGQQREKGKSREDQNDLRLKISKPSFDLHPRTEIFVSSTQEIAL
jgi:hypothetical protein